MKTLTDNSLAQSQTYEPYDPELNRQASKTKRKWVIILAGLALVFFVVLPGFAKYIPYMDKPDLCLNCHAMEQHYVSWQYSSHNKVSCLGCHFGPVIKEKVNPKKVTNKQYWNITFGDQTINVSPIMNKLKGYVERTNKTIEIFRVEWNYKIAFISKSGQLVRMFLGGRQDGAEKTWSNCAVCHSDISAKNSKFDSTGHNKHLGIGLTCQECHGNVAHDTQVKLKQDDCAKCHNKGLPKPKTHGNSEFVRNHGKMFLQKNSCRICHNQGAKQKVCMDCHGLEMPHKPVYVSVHTDQIKLMGVKRCQNCHYDEPKGKTGSYSSGLASQKKKEVTCVNCHGNKLFHSKGVAIKTHGKRVLKEGNSACITCHKTQECTSCHGGVQMPHPRGFMQQHPAAAKKGNIENCVQCHNMGENTPVCINCHWLEMPHPEGFLTEHEGLNEPGCEYCHDASQNPVKNSAGAAVVEARSSKKYCRICH